MGRRSCSRRYLLLMLMLLGQPVWSAEPVNIAVREDFSLSGLYVRILTEAYRRADIPVKFTFLPGGRSLKYSNEGILGIDGEAGRLSGVLNRYANLRKVETPIYRSELTAFSRSEAFPARTWQDLAGYAVTTRIGFKVVIDRLGSNNLKMVEDSATALRLVEKGRADVAVLARRDGLRILKSLQMHDVHAQAAPIEVLPVYHMLHKRHEKLLPRLNAALKSMADEGLLARMADPPKITLTTGIRQPMVDSDTAGGFVEGILKQAFRRAGAHVQISNVPSKLSLLNANSGRDDGLALRIAGLEKKYTNLIRVPESIMCNEFTAYSKGHRIEIDSWGALASHSTAYVNGWRIFERNLQPGKHVLKVDNPDLLFDMLRKQRTEVALYEKWQGLALAKELGMKDIVGNRLPIPQLPMFVYLHKQHAQLVQPVARAMKAMKRDGSYQRIFQTSLAPLIPRDTHSAAFAELLTCQ